MWLLSEKSRRLGPEVKLVLFQRRSVAVGCSACLRGSSGWPYWCRRSRPAEASSLDWGPGAGAAFGMAFELARSGDASRQFQSALSALIAAFICALVGLVLGGLLTRLLKRGRA